MWHKVSIRTQLVIIMTLLVTLIQIATLVSVNQIDTQEREAFAIEQAENLTRSLNNDLLKLVLNPVASTFSDINFRVSGFDDVANLIVLNEQDKPIYKYGDGNWIEQNRAKLADNTLLFLDNHLLIKSPIQTDDHTFGHALTSIDLGDYKEQQERHLLMLFLLFPVALLVAFLVSWLLSLSFTRPFSQLAQSMLSNDVSENRFAPVETAAKNEVGALFEGYNQMIQKVETTTEQIRYQSEHDELTGLYNRFYMDKALQSALQDENAETHVLLNVDLDQFKLINDSAGHVAGNELLKMIAHGCSEELPDNAVMARVGGDDFYILLRNTSAEDGLAFAKTRLGRLSDFRFVWEGQALSVSATIGMVTFKPFEYTLEELIKVADSAFYTAKSAGRNQLHVYHPGDSKSQQFNREVQVAGFIKEALAKEGERTEGKSRFELFAQDIVPLQYDTEQVSYEILIRMWDAEGNFVPPDAFLPTAERYQMMAEIDAYVLRTYLEMVSQYPDHIEKLHVAHINLAGSSLNNADFQANLRQLVNEFDFPWQKLELEVTETSAVGNFNQAAEFIRYCKDLGIGLALDDFGTGMSSFEYLKSLPFDVVKIDGSFVKDMHTDPSDKAVIRYIQEISALRNQETVAEYVETEQDVIELTQIGITYGQGYFLGKPKPLSDWLTPPDSLPS